MNQKQNPERIMIVLFPLITLSLYMAAVFISWIVTFVLPAMGVIGK
jgi:hypothetical protein